MTDLEIVIELVKLECEKHSVDFIIDNSFGDYSGEYHDRKNFLKVFIHPDRDEEQMITTLLHELSHLQQDKEKAKAWTNYINVFKSKEDDEIFFEWLDGKEVDLNYIDRITEATMNMEADCELRTIEHIKKLGLDINMEEYNQKSNAYVLFYHYARKNRKWYNAKKAPYILEDIWRAMPQYIIKEPYKEDLSKYAVLEKCFD